MGAPRWKPPSWDEVLCPSSASPWEIPAGGKAPGKGGCPGLCRGSVGEQLSKPAAASAAQNVFAWIGLKITGHPCDLKRKTIFDLF